MTGSKRSVAIIHPWLPHYRVGFFELLRSSLADHGIELHLAHGSDPPFACGRGGEGSLPWARRLRERSFKAGGRTIVWREQWRPALEADLLIVEDALRNLDTYPYLVRRSIRHLPTAFWGPGATLDREAGRFEQLVKRCLLRRGDWWFGYTQGSARRLIAAGAAPARVTAVGNTFDTGPLVRAAADLGEPEVHAMRASLGLTEGHSVLYIGGLARVKNLALLLEAGKLISASDPDFRVVIIGDGPTRTDVERAASELGFVVLLEPTFDPRQKALVARACDLMAAPGLVGLVAVDSLVLGRPIVTVMPWTHSPEVEYLEDGRNALFTLPNPVDFATAIRRLIEDRPLRERLARSCMQDGEQFSLDRMVSRFTDGVLGALNERA